MDAKYQAAVGGQSEREGHYEERSNIIYKSPTHFADQSAISSYAADAVAWARSAGIISGKGGNRFDPQGSATRPALESHVADMDQYDVILLGYPIWHGNTPMPVHTFLTEYNLSGKVIAPFSTSGSGGIGSAVAAVRALCPDSEVVDGLSLPGSSLPQPMPWQKSG